MSNNNGNLEFYTNGVTVRNFADQVIGDNLHAGYYLTNINGWLQYGNPLREGFMNVPNPQNQNLYDLFYAFGDTVDDGNSASFRYLKFSRVDMSMSGGVGGMTFKDQIFSTTPSSNCLSMVKHANGRDWWIITMEEGTKCYKKFIYDGSTTIKVYPNQCINSGFQYNQLDYSLHRFSPDGNYMASIDNEQGKCDFFGFDRCSGELTFLEEVFFPEKFDSVDYPLFGGEFSPNSRYFYVCANKKIYQFDMQANPIGTSKTTVAPNISNLPSPFSFNHAQLGPDGRIYVGSMSTTYYFAVINDPNKAGSFCLFQDTIRAASVLTSLPSYPNYRLGALDNSLCDTLGLSVIDQQKEKNITVYPNPASEWVTLDYGFMDWSKGEVALQIINSLGQVVMEQQLPAYSAYRKLDVSHLANGLYKVTLNRKGQVINSATFVKE